jgi:putative transcriptional regulator
MTESNLVGTAGEQRGAGSQASVRNVALMLCRRYAFCVARKSKSELSEQVFSRLAVERERANISRQELADLVGVHYQTIGYLERGEYSPSLVLALRIAAALSMPIESIFSLEPLEAPVDERNR